MELVVLGSGTSVPVPDRALPGHLVRAGGLTILLDGGAGTGRQLARAGVSLLDLDLICYTHRHLDHVSELPQLLFALHIPRFGRTKPLTIVGPPGFAAYVRDLRRLHAPWLDAPYGLEVHERLDDTFVAGDVRIEAHEVRHVKPSVAYRIEHGGRTLVYSGDTGECPEIVTAGRGADLFLLECAQPDHDPVDIHLTPTQCGRIAAAAAPRRLVLTHFYP
ncbi:MAG TPA: ribonuclease Z, partial [Thermodesulfobacteriota bacterium]|nr:ribonuclease Z [Thermodesulfobacteriota bacterium]